MKKKLLLLTMGLLLVSCGGENSSPTSNNPVSNGPSSVESTSTPTSESIGESIGESVDNPTSDSSTQPDVYEKKHHEYIFTDVMSNFSSDYITKTLKCDDAGFNFMNASKQATNITNVPVVDAGTTNYTYVTLLSDSPYDLSRIGMSISFFSEGDAQKLGEDYFVGMEYLYNDTWEKASHSVNKALITVGAIQSEGDMFYFNVERPGVRKIRIVFEVSDIGERIRFGIYSMYIEGQSKVITTNETTSSVSINDIADNKVLVNSEVQLSANVVASNGLATPILWSSSDRYIATIDENGLVKGVTTGEVTISASSGQFTDSINLSIVDDLDIDSYIQPSVEFSNCENLPAGFTSNITEDYGDSIKLANTGDYLLTPTYEAVGAKTRVTIRIKHSSGNSEAKENIIAVIGINANGEEVEEKTIVGFNKTNYEDIPLEFTNTTIVQYKVLYKYKAIQAGASYPVGKNYGLQALEIVKLSA